MRWAAAMQTELLQLPWPEAVLAWGACAEERDAGGRLVWRGLRVRMGLAWGGATYRKPLNTGEGCVDALRSSSVHLQALRLPSVGSPHHRQIAAHMQGLVLYAYVMAESELGQDKGHCIETCCLPLPDTVGLQMSCHCVLAQESSCCCADTSDLSPSVPFCCRPRGLLWLDPEPGRARVGSGGAWPGATGGHRPGPRRHGAHLTGGQRRAAATA